RNATRVEHARRQCPIDTRLAEHAHEMINRAGAARSDQRHVAGFANRTELLDVVTLAHAVAAHAVEDHLARTQPLHLGQPVERAAGQCVRTIRIAGELVHAPFAVGTPQTVDAYHHALTAECLRQLGDQRRPLQRWRVDRYLVSARMQHLAGLLDRADAAGDAEWNVDDARNLLDPTAVDAAVLRAGGDVVEHQFVGTLVAIAQRQRDDVTHVNVVAEPHALDHAPVAYVEAGNDPPAQHRR